MAGKAKKTGMLHVRRYVVSGIVTSIPLFITWVLFEFIFRQLSTLGMPWVRMLSRALSDDSPAISRWLLESWFQNVLAALIVLTGFYVLGWTVNRVVGRRIINFLESLLRRLPFVRGVYTSVKQLITVLQQAPSGAQRVVLIDFPNSSMKAVGFVTRSIVDKETGKKLLAVYVPTTPNPTAGYLEVVPVERVVSTDWTVEEAMNFIISGGAVGPEMITYGCAQEGVKAEGSGPAGDVEKEVK